MARRLIKLVEEVLVNSTRHAARVCSGRAPSSARQPADLHPLPWRLALLTTALRAVRSPRLCSVAKKAAWHLAVRCASAALLDLRRPPATTPPEDARALEEVVVREQRLSLACVQPLALRAVAGGMSADAADISATSDATATDSSTATSEETVAYIDIEGALLTSSGGRFGREFDDVLSSFRFDELDGAHHLAHRAPSTFDEISSYEMAFSAVGSAFTSLHSKLLTLKPRLAELAALLLGGALGGAGSTAKAEQLLAALTDDVVTKLLKDEAEAVLSTALEALQQGVSDARRWCAAHAKAAQAKLIVTERLVNAIASSAHAAAVCKSRQGETLRSGYRGPRFDSGQPLAVLDRSQAR